MNFNVEQTKVINSISGNLVVIATAGSGKTTVLTYRIKNMVEQGIDPFHILAITFSTKAKENIEQKLPKLGVYGVSVETFHSLALKIITAAYGRKYKVWTVPWEKEKLITDICTTQLSLCSKNDVPYNDIVRFIAIQKYNNLYPNDELIYKKDLLPFTKEQMREIYEKYEEYKNQHSYIEFDDFLNMANDVLSSYYDISKQFQDKFQFILSDEFQDVSMPQSVLLKRLNTTNTMIVGDPLQAIYSFRGGRSEYILNFDKDYKDTKVINLNTNYRCSEDIVALANTLANYIPDSKTEHYVESKANNQTFMVPEYRNFDTEYDENNWIVEQIKKKKENYTYRDIAVLTRTNAQLTKLQADLKKNLIPYEVVNGMEFTELPEIKLLISYLKLALYDNDNAAFSYLYNKPLRWLDQKFLEEVRQNSLKRNVSYYNAMMTIDRRNWRFKNGIEEIHEVINTLQNKRYKNVGDMIRYLRSRLDIDNFVSKGKFSEDGNSTEQIENMDAFENIADQYQSLQEFINYLNTTVKKNLSENKDMVQLSTIHRAKGLEYPVVFLPGLNDGLLPHKKSNDIQDERRLFYVGITRAEKELYISSSEFYNNKLMKVSPFITDIQSKLKCIN